MAELQFPNVGNALAAGSAAAYNLGRSRREAEAERMRKDAQQYIEPALRGDQSAFAKVVASDPAAGASVAQALARMDAATLAKAKAATEYTTGVTTGLLAAPEGERERLYQQTRADAQAKGMDVSRWPASYDDGWVRMQHGIGIGAKSWFEQSQQNQRHATPSGGASEVVDMPGGTSASSDGTTTGGDDASSGAASGYRPPVGNTRAARAIGGIESGDRYDAVGPVANSKGNRAYGKYQVMDFNVGPWTQEFIGRAMTPQEFLADPEAQNRVFEGKFGQYVQKYGSAEAAARAWFAGEGGMNNPNASDVNGMTVARYGSKFNSAMGGGNPLSAARGGGASYGDPGPIAAMPTSPLESSVPPANTAQMPGAPTSLFPSGPPPAPMPEPIPGLPQGGDLPQADSSGTPLPPRPVGAEKPAQPGQSGGFLDRDPIALGYKPVGVMKNGVIQQAVENGYFVFYDPRTGNVKTGARAYYHPRDDVEKLRREADAKRRAENPNAVQGPFQGTSIAGTALNMKIRSGALTLDQAADVALGKVVTGADGAQYWISGDQLISAAGGARPIGAPLPQTQGNPPLTAGPTAVPQSSPSAAGPQALPAQAPAAPPTSLKLPPKPSAPPPVASPPSAQPGMIPLTPPRPQTMNEGQSSAASYADRMRKADAIIQRVGSAGLDTMGKLLEKVPFGAGNYLQSSEYQLYEQARRDFINAILRDESGAVISEEEFANAEKQYIPRPGDSPEVLRQKADNRRTAIEGISRAAGPTYKPPTLTPPKSGGRRPLDAFGE